MEETVDIPSMNLVAGVFYPGSKLAIYWSKFKEIYNGIYDNSNNNSIISLIINELNKFENLKKICNICRNTNDTEYNRLKGNAEWSSIFLEIDMENFIKLKNELLDNISNFETIDKMLVKIESNKYKNIKNKQLYKDSFCKIFDYINQQSLYTKYKFLSSNYSEIDINLIGIKKKIKIYYQNKDNKNDNRLVNMYHDFMYNLFRISSYMSSYNQTFLNKLNIIYDDLIRFKNNYDVKLAEYYIYSEEDGPTKWYSRRFESGDYNTLDEAIIGEEKAICNWLFDNHNNLVNSYNRSDIDDTTKREEMLIIYFYDRSITNPNRPPSSSGIGGDLGPYTYDYHNWDYAIRQYKDNYTLVCQDKSTGALRGVLRGLGEWGDCVSSNGNVIQKATDQPYILVQYTGPRYGSLSGGKQIKVPYNSTLKWHEIDNNYNVNSISTDFDNFASTLTLGRNFDSIWSKIVLPNRTDPDGGLTHPHNGVWNHTTSSTNYTLRNQPARYFCTDTGVNNLFKYHAYKTDGYRAVGGCSYGLTWAHTFYNWVQEDDLWKKKRDGLGFIVYDQRAIKHRYVITFNDLLDRLKIYNLQNELDTLNNLNNEFKLEVFCNSLLFLVNSDWNKKTLTDYNNFKTSNDKSSDKVNDFKGLILLDILKDKFNIDLEYVNNLENVSNMFISSYNKTQTQSIDKILVEFRIINF